MAERWWWSERVGMLRTLPDYFKELRKNALSCKNDVK